MNSSKLGVVDTRTVITSIIIHQGVNSLENIASAYLSASQCKEVDNLSAK